MGFCLCDGYVMFSHGHRALAMEVWLCDGVCVCGGRGFGMREGQRFEMGDIDFNEEVYNKIIIIMII